MADLMATREAMKSVVSAVERLLVSLVTPRICVDSFGMFLLWSARRQLIAEPSFHGASSLWRLTATARVGATTNRSPRRLSYCVGGASAERTANALRRWSSNAIRWPCWRRFGGTKLPW